MNEKLEKFLIEAKKGTYANETAEKITSSRRGSHDYAYTSDDMVYHDTYFGGTNFMGEEVVYLEEDTPIWGMNYYGITLDASVSEEAMDKVLRPALMQVGKDAVIPIRGPREYQNGEYRFRDIFEYSIKNTTINLEDMCPVLYDYLCYKKRQKGN